MWPNRLFRPIHCRGKDTSAVAVDTSSRLGQESGGNAPRKAFWQKEQHNPAEFTVSWLYRLRMVSPTSFQLNLFDDASEKEFCAVEYFSFEYPSGERKCAFVVANTCVAPVKPISILGLELQATVLSVWLAYMIQKEHDYGTSFTYYWTDIIAVIVHCRILRAS